MTRREPSRPAAAGEARPASAEGDRPATGRPADADGLAPYKETLRQHFPTPEEIFEQAARRRRARRAVGTAVAIAVVAGMLWLVDPAYRQEQFATAVGERADHLLADGSRMTLNTGTSAVVAWHLRSRRVRLERGEALFDVAHGPRDFVVSARDTMIRDIGTVFNVRVDPPGTGVTVLEGAVEVSTGETSTVLEAGQAVRVARGRIEPQALVDTAAAVAWERGKLVFDGTPLAAAVAEMQRYRSRPIVLADERLGRLRLSGEFDVRNVDALLELLPEILPVALRRTPDGTVTLSTQKK